MTLFFGLTHSCQLRCDYCYTGEKYKKSATKETLLQSIEFTFSFPMQKLEFGFFGGEPLLEWELLQFTTLAIEERAELQNIALVKTLTTNGLLLDREKTLWLREHGFYIVLSIDGNEAMHNTHRYHPNQKGSFSEVKQAIETLQSIYKVGEYCTISVVTPQNIAHLNASVAYLHETLHIRDIHLSPNYYTTWEEDTQPYSAYFHTLGEYVIEQYRNHTPVHIDFIESKIASGINTQCDACSFGELKLAIAPSGNLYPCEKLIGEDTGELSIGNVFDGFDHTKRNALIAQRGNIDEECQSCPLKERCMNNCGCTNYTLTGNINTTGGVVCFFQKLFIEVADKVAATLYREKNRLFLEKFYGE